MQNHEIFNDILGGLDELSDRKAVKDLQSLALQCQIRYKRAKAESLGWENVHGGEEEGGAFWRGKNPATGQVEAIPDQLFKQ